MANEEKGPVDRPETVDERTEKMKADRELFWWECDPETKCERLRQMMHHQANRIEALEAMVAELVEHRHLADGQIVKPVTPAPFVDRRCLRNHVKVLRGAADDVWI